MLLRLYRSTVNEKEAPNIKIVMSCYIHTDYELPIIYHSPSVRLWRYSHCAFVLYVLVLSRSPVILEPLTVLFEMNLVNVIYFTQCIASRVTALGFNEI